MPDVSAPRRALSQAAQRLRKGPIARRVGVFSVDTTWVQVAWAALGPGPVRFRAAGTVVELDLDGGPGAVTLDGLSPASRVEITLDGEGVPGGHLTLQAATLRPPPGEELCRLATISDLHMGESGFGYLGGIREPGSPEPYTKRCTEAAIAEAAGWGAQLLVVKGDITHRATPEEWVEAGKALAESPLPVVAVPGNHDNQPGWRHSRQREVTPQDGAALGGIELVEGVECSDLPGLRLVLVDSTVPGQHHGSLRRQLPVVVEALREAAAAGDGSLVVLHHHFQRHALPTFWPPGLGREEAERFLDAVAAANPSTLVTSGHTHRHRRAKYRTVTATTVGSVKDYPGVWAGYAVHEGGIRQVVRRVARPDVIRWTERSGDTMAGLYRRWTPGRLEERCFTLDYGTV